MLQLLAYAGKLRTIQVLWRALFLAISLLCLNACRAPIAEGLPQALALEVAASLRQAGFDARHQNNSGSFSVTVPQDEVNGAIVVLVDNDLLAESAPLPTNPRASFDPASALRRHEDERARTLARALEALPNVRSATVTLSLCEPNPRQPDACAGVNRVSALLVLNPLSDPPDIVSLERWLSASVPGVDADRVELVLSWAASVAGHSEPSLSPTPITDHRLLIGSAAAALLLTIGGVGLSIRKRRAQSNADPVSPQALAITRAEAT